MAFRPERLLAYIGFERRATGLRLDPPLRFRAAEIAAVDPVLPNAIRRARARGGVRAVEPGDPRDHRQSLPAERRRSRRCRRAPPAAAAPKGPARRLGAADRRRRPTRRRRDSARRSAPSARRVQERLTPPVRRRRHPRSRCRRPDPRRTTRPDASTARSSSTSSLPASTPSPGDGSSATRPRPRWHATRQFTRSARRPAPSRRLVVEHPWRPRPLPRIPTDRDTPRPEWRRGRADREGSPSHCSPAPAGSTSASSRPATTSPPPWRPTTTPPTRWRRTSRASSARSSAQSILDVPTKDILRAAGLKGRERPDLLVGGPPCTPFSKSGFWLEWKRAGLDPDASLLQAYTRVLAEARPRAFILENVYALTYNNKASRPAFERLQREIDEAGYTCDWKVLNAADYGVPQLRPRLFVVGAPKGRKTPQLPEPTHHGRWERRTTGEISGRPHVTTGEALAGLVTTSPEPEEVLRGQWAHLLPGVPPGDNYLHYTAERGHPEPVFEWRSRYWSFLLKLSPDRPSPTIQAQPGPNVGPFHWDNRRLRVPGAEATLHLPRRLRIRRESRIRASTGRQLRAATPRCRRRSVPRHLGGAWPQTLERARGFQARPQNVVGQRSCGAPIAGARCRRT